jgi:hypothetical protein
MSLVSLSKGFRVLILILWNSTADQRSKGTFIWNIEVAKQMKNVKITIKKSRIH